MGIAVWLALTEPRTHVAGRLPVAAKDSFPSIALIPPTLPPEARRLRTTVLAPLGHSTARLVDTPALPPSELPETVVLPLKLTVLGTRRS